MLQESIDRFWSFMREREAIRLRRLEGSPPMEWTSDPIFKQFSFTNVKRLHDRTTTLLKREFYDKYELHHPCKEALLNAVIFRYFGRIETARVLGWHMEWNETTHARMVSLIRDRLLLGFRAFTSAYIVPNCGDSRPKHEVVAIIIGGIWNVVWSIVSQERWELSCHVLKSCFGVGSFMAKEILLDYILATSWKPDDWETWTPVGPGARRGAGVLELGIVKGISEYDALLVCRALHAMRTDYWPIDYVPLDLTDIQFQLCEFAKYEKARTGVGRPKSLFRPTIDDVTQRG